MLEIVLYY